MNNLIENQASIMVRNIFINNKFGRFWNAMRYCVPAVTDLNARHGKFTTPWDTKPDAMFAPPPFKFINDKLSDILDERALELNNIAKLENKKIFIMWSGGIDSTAVLTAFIKNISVQDLENYTVVLSASSIEENPVFYEKFIKGKIKCIPYLEYQVCNSELETSISLNGDPADCIFGPSLFAFKHLVPTGGHLMPYKDNIKVIISALEKNSEQYIKLFKVPNFGAWYVNKITKNLMEVSPPDVETISDWWWWHYYNFKWQFSVWRPFYRRKTKGLEYEPLTQSNLQSFVTNTFYNTDRFQLWSYSNRRNHIINNDIRTHKHEVKQYILDLDQNYSYHTNKSKVQSIPIYDHGVYFEVRKPFFWTKDWVGYYDNECPELVAECVSRLESYKG